MDSTNIEMGVRRGLEERVFLNNTDNINGDEDWIAFTNV